jgi:hypothetical protein
MKTASERRRIAKIHRELKTKLKSNELRYDMSSKDFYDLFQSGQLPELEEYFRWRVDYAGLMRIEKSYPWLIEDENMNENDIKTAQYRIIISGLIDLIDDASDEHGNIGAVFTPEYQDTYVKACRLLNRNPHEMLV